MKLRLFVSKLLGVVSEMTAKQLRQLRQNYFHGQYQLVRFDGYRYRRLKNIMYLKRAGRSDHDSYNDCIIMADTETSKSDTKGNEPEENHIVAFTISIRAFEENIVTLYGTKPSEFIQTLDKLQKYLKGDKTIIYFHNLPYDWVFLRKFLIEKYGSPVKMLATKPHYPIYIEFDNGLIFKDSLILAQRSLEKWAADMAVEHQKAVGKWDYLKVRHQKDVTFTSEELEYIEHDTLAGVECIDKLMKQLGKRIYSMPYTATGIPREESRKRGKLHNARADFERMVTKDYKVQQMLEDVYHGGYTHANRHYIGLTIDGTDTDPILAMDFTSSYPYCMLAFKYPCTEFTPFRNCTPEELLSSADNYAFIFKLILVNVRLKDDNIPMPALQFSKAKAEVNSVCDNGRILCANYVEIYINEIDLAVIADQYKWEAAACIDVHYAEKHYLPRWYTDYVFECFTDKTMLKGGDPVAYSLAKAKVNSLYGMMVQKPCREDIIENYMSGEYEVSAGDYEEKYEKYLKNRNSILNYAWGVYVTSYAFYNLFQLGKCCGLWLYSDTDSCYGKDWDMEKVKAYNDGCKKRLIDNGYGAVMRDGKAYWLGVVDVEKHDQFKTMGAKRYCVRDGDQLKITVAGVPKKKGALCLDNDINNFAEGFIFSGKKTGKQTHTYFFADDIHTDEHSNEIGDSIDLSPCDYLLSSVEKYDWQSLFDEEIKVQIYEE